MHVCDMHIMHFKRVNVTTCSYATHSRPKLYGQTCTLFKTVGTKKELATAILTSIVVNAVTIPWTKKLLGLEKRKT